MSAPVASVRTDPDTVGIKLKDGYQTLVVCALNPAIEFWEKQITPPGIDGGDEIDQTTMLNDEWRTRAPRSLKTLTNCEVTAAYDPVLYTSILAIINRETTWTVIFPDGSTLAFFGFLRNFDPQEVTEGEQPEASITIVPTNFDPVGKVEEDPVMVEVAGT